MTPAAPRLSLPTSAKLAALPLLAALVIACGGGAPATQQPVEPGATRTPPASAGATPAAATPTQGGSASGLCALVDQATAADAVGEAVDAGTPDQSVLTGASSCLYKATDSANWFKVEYHPDAERADWDHSMTTLGMEERADGLGDADFRYSGRSSTKISVWEGDHYIWVVVNKAGDNTVFEAKIEAIARNLLENL